MKKITKQSGFTLIEVLLATGLHILIGALVAPATIGMYRSQIARSTADEIFSTMKKAQAYALYRRGDSDHGIHFSENEFVLFKGGVFDSNSSTNETHELNNLEVSFEPGGESTGTIVFNKATGTPDWFGTIIFSNGPVTQHISICDSGIIEFSDSCDLQDDD